MTTDYIAQISKIYKSAGFEETKLPQDFILRFANDFSIHFVFLFESFGKMKEDWEAAHDLLIDHYRAHEGSPDMEWNYYSVFVVPSESMQKQDYRELKRIIESNTAYSRKFVFSDSEFDELPPGMIRAKELSSREISFKNPLESWEGTLGKELFGIVLDGPKSSIKERIKAFIQGNIDGD